jgi:hypothetical protein
MAWKTVTNSHVLSEFFRGASPGGMSILGYLHIFGPFAYLRIAGFSIPERQTSELSPRVSIMPKHVNEEKQQHTSRHNGRVRNRLSAAAARGRQAGGLERRPLPPPRERVRLSWRPGLRQRLGGARHIQSLIFHVPHLGAHRTPDESSLTARLHYCATRLSAPRSLLSAISSLLTTAYHRSPLTAHRTPARVTTVRIINPDIARFYTLCLPPLTALRSPLTAHRSLSVPPAGVQVVAERGGAGVPVAAPGRARLPSLHQPAGRAWQLMLSTS